MTRFPQEAFLDLLNWLKGHTDLDDSNLVSAEEKLFMFLYIVAHGTKFRVIAELFQHCSRQQQDEDHILAGGRS